jgi:Protein of unknown function (DUF3147)
MVISVRLSALSQTRWYEYAIRFVLGGATTVFAGLVATSFGPVIGGLFLAFPAIFPASATLVEKHERERKERHGLAGRRRSKEAAALEAAGAVMGNIGLVAFGAIVWRLTPPLSGLALLIAAIAWLAVSVLLWLARRPVRRIV